MFYFLIFSMFDAYFIVDNKSLGFSMNLLFCGEWFIEIDFMCMGL